LIISALFKFRTYAVGRRRGLSKKKGSPFRV
jgi:hypothetical protein